MDLEHCVCLFSHTCALCGLPSMKWHRIIIIACFTNTSTLRSSVQTPHFVFSYGVYGLPPYSAHDPSYTAKLPGSLRFSRCAAKKSTQAVVPDPHLALTPLHRPYENTIGSLRCRSTWMSANSFASSSGGRISKFFSGFATQENGMLRLPGMCPEVSPGRASGTVPSNRPLGRASITVRSVFPFLYASMRSIT